MSTTFVLLGFPVYGCDPQGPPVPIAVSADKAKLEAYGNSLRDTTHNLMRPGGSSWPPVYVHEGQKFEHVRVMGPVLDLDGPKVVVANTVGTINM